MSQRATTAVARGAACVATLVGAMVAAAQAPAQADPCTSSMVAPPAYCVPAQAPGQQPKADAKEQRDASTGAPGAARPGGNH